MPLTAHSAASSPIALVVFESRIDGSYFVKLIGNAGNNDPNGKGCFAAQSECMLIWINEHLAYSRIYILNLVG
jgi:hypothetical protein